MVELTPTRCAICRLEGDATELYPATFTPASLNPSVFSARRTPDRLHYRIVKCNRCGLVRSDPATDPEQLKDLYARSGFTYQGEVADLRHTYGRYLKKLEQFGTRKEALLEVGCGNGFFLEEALAQGYETVRGVEPGREAVALASERIKSFLLCGMMCPGLFAAGQFDVICLFQVLDHFPDPAAVLKECLAVVRPGGLMLALNHNVEAWSARVMGEASPIIDIEHTYLYSPRTMKRLFEECGFEVLDIAPAWNRFPLRYLLRLSPLPGRLKTPTAALLEKTRLASLRLSLPLGNLYLIGRRPPR
jgi:2-polyprenyl-3-methyl-5-hydroxy-6-metoxy-1,4-benzoquinol methylase